MLVLRVAHQEYGRIDILVSNATVNPYAGPLAEVPPDAIDKILDVNIKVGRLTGGRCVLTWHS